jgi:hypothetical protein
MRGYARRIYISPRPRFAAVASIVAATSSHARRAGRRVAPRQLHDEALAAASE